MKVYLKLSKLFPEGESVQVQNVHKGNIQSVYHVLKVFALKYEGQSGKIEYYFLI